MADDRPPLASFDTSKRPPLSSFASPVEAPEAGGKPLSDSAKQQTSSFADFFKSIPRGVVSGLAGTAARSGQAEMGLQTGGADTMQNLSGLVTGQKPQGVPGPEESTRLAEQHLTGKLPEPQGPAGKFGAAIGEALGTPTSYLGPASLTRNVVSGVGGALGGEAAGQMTGDSPTARVIGGALGGLAGGTRGVARVAETPAPARGAIRDAAEAAYDTIKTSPRKIPMEETSVLAENIRNKLNEEGVYREAPDGIAIFKTVDRLNAAVNAGHVTPAEIHSMTKTLQKISNSNPGNSTGRAAGIARQELFNYLEKFPELSEAIQVGNANYRAFKTSERIGLAKEKGEFGARSTMTGDNLDPALRTQLRQMYFNKKVSKTPEEKEILRSIIEGDTTSNIAKKFNLLKSPLRHMATAVMHAKGAGVLSHAAQMLAKSIANRNTARQVDKLDELVRSTAPVAGPRAAASTERSTRGAQRAIQAGRGAITGGRDEQKPNLYEQ